MMSIFSFQYLSFTFLHTDLTYVNLSAADPDFNPFVDLQAQARAHRIGQENVVLVYQLITKCSVEEKIIERSRQKLAMENLVMSKDAKDTAADVNTLLLHGARKVLEEHDVEATSVKWTNENIQSLLSRDISETKDVKEGGAGYLGAVQEPGGVLGVHSVDKSPLKTGREWDDLLGKFAEQDMEAEDAKLGRGKRQRRKIQYNFAPNINANEDEDEGQDGKEDDPSCSGEASSLSESDSDVSLDDEKGRGVRGPYLSKVKSMKEEQGVSSSIPQQYPGQGPSQPPTSNPPIFTAPLASPKHSQPSQVGPLSYLPSYPNQSSLTQPTYRSPPPWPTASPPPTKLTAVSSSSQSPGVSHSYFTAPHPLAGNDISASPGSLQGSKPYWEYSAPRTHGSSMPSISTSQAYQTLKSPLSSPREHPNPIRNQVHGAPMPYQTSASHNFSELVSPKGLKVTPSPKSMQQGKSPNVLNPLKVTTTSRSVQQGTRPPITSSGPTAVLEFDGKHLSSPLGPGKTSSNSGSNLTQFPMPKSHSIPFQCDKRAVDVMQDGGTVQGGFLHQLKEQPCPADYLSFAEVLRRTGSQLSGSQVSPTLNVLQDAKGLSLGDVLRQTGSPLSTSQASPASHSFRDAKDLSLEDVLRQTGSTLSASKHFLTTGTPSQLYEETKNMSLEDVLRRTGATNMRIEDVYKRTGSTAPGTQSQLLQDSTNLSLEEVLRQTGSKLIAPKKDMLPKPPVLPKNAPKLLEPLGDLNLKESSSTESRQAKSAALRPSSEISLDTKSTSSDAVSQQSIATRTGTKEAVSLGAKSKSSGEVSPRSGPPFFGTKQVVSSRNPSENFPEPQLTLSNQSHVLRPKVEAEREVPEIGGRSAGSTCRPASGNS